ncbi:hypothetical protein [Bartonella sp. WD16.2]|uniref:hypothetical protein n=1 Tax=Bartonella sp. WD16.2 TaxID=1933904 RepID=UPI00099AD625|nr:hypothetical protein [Bartonella sp. WD16.2]AQX20352.1 hypothetical protein BWD162_012600 [Bartonella sp. WD16.2]
MTYNNTHALQENHTEQHTLPQDEPLDPAVERVRKKLMRLMIISISITIILILFVFAGIIYKIITPEIASKQTNSLALQSDNLPFANHTLSLPPKAQIISQSLSDHHIALRILMPNGQTHFMIYNYRTGAPIANLVITMTQETSVTKHLQVQ